MMKKKIVTENLGNTSTHLHIYIKPSYKNVFPYNSTKVYLENY